MCPTIAPAHGTWLTPRWGYPQYPSQTPERSYRHPVDTKQEIQEFLTSRRARITPAQAGIRTFGSGPRRVPGLRREEVASLAGVSIAYYTKLESGDASGVSDSVLGALSFRALQLDDAERSHLFDLVRAQQPVARTRRRRSAPPTLRPSVQLLERRIAAHAGESDRRRPDRRGLGRAV